MVLVRTQFIFLRRRQDTAIRKACATAGIQVHPTGVCTGDGWFADQPVPQNSLYGYAGTRINTERRTRNYVTQLMAMGYRVTSNPPRFPVRRFAHDCSKNTVIWHRAIAGTQFRRWRNRCLADLAKAADD
jgi:hypothetical protein